MSSKRIKDRPRDIKAKRNKESVGEPKEANCDDATARLKKYLALEQHGRALLRLTLDQLRTIIFIKEKGSPREAAKALGRDQSSVQKQLDALNEYFEDLCGEPLATKRDRGQDYAITGTCVVAAELAEELLTTWANRFDDRRREVGRKFVVATTTFTIRVLGRVWGKFRSEIGAADLQVTQIRTKDFWRSLQDGSVDLLVGGLPVECGKMPKKADFDFLEWDRDSLCILTNHDVMDLPNSPITSRELQKYKLILPRSGVIEEFVRECYGDGYERNLKLEPRIDDVFYGIHILRYNVMRGCMFATNTVAEYAMKFPNLDDFYGDYNGSLGSNGLRKIELGNGFKNMEIVCGLFGRKGERSYLEKNKRDHPLAIIWRVFEEERPKTKQKK
ncbi:hypothetical protein ACFLU6_02065 [Acidobacteriota bacterium]